jgi:hypothetical protein
MLLSRRALSLRVSISVSIATPESQIPSIHSQLTSIVSEPPHEILTHDVNKLLSYLHDTNNVRDAQHEGIFLDLTQKFGFQRDSMRNMVSTSLRLAPSQGRSLPSRPY